jgi:hypothetical protein
MNTRYYRFDQDDIDAVTAKLRTRFPGLERERDVNLAGVAVSLLREVMIDRRKRDAERRKQWPRKALRLAARGALEVGGVLTLIAIGVLGTLLYLGVLPDSLNR